MNTEQLKQAALKATPGPWIYQTSKRQGGSGNYQLVLSEDENSVAECYGIDLEDAANARYIAAANPATILAMLGCVEALHIVRAVIIVQRDLIERNTHDAAWNPTIELIDSSIKKLEEL